MKRRALGNTGVNVSELSLGTGFMAGQGQQGVNECIVTGFKNPHEIESNVNAIERGPLPANLQSEIDAIGIIHPLLYQGRTTI